MNATTPKSDEENEPTTCNLCGAEYDMPDGYEPTEFCNDCAHKMVTTLKAQNEQQARDIETLKLDLNEGDALLKAQNERLVGALLQAAKRLSEEGHPLDAEEAKAVLKEVGK